MSRYFGPIRQNGYIVHDLNDAIKYWTEVLGVGPFYILEHVPLDHFTYAGVSSNPDLSIALAFCGDLQIELVHQLNDARTPYRDFFLSKGPGLQHVSVWSEQYDSDLASLAASGRVPDCDGAISGAGRFAYFQSANQDGTVMEIADLGASPEIGKLFESMRQAAATWDGADPIRNLF